MKTSSFLKKIAWGLVIFIGLSNAVSAQKIQVNGKVMLAADSSALPGVTIRIKNTNIGSLQFTGKLHDTGKYRRYPTFQFYRVRNSKYPGKREKIKCLSKRGRNGHGRSNHCYRIRSHSS